MKPSLTINQSEFNRLANELAKVKNKTQFEILTELGKTFVSYLIAITPPFGKNPIREFKGGDTKLQQRIGMNAVRRDVNRLFWRFPRGNKESIIGQDQDKWSKSVDRLVRKRDFNGLKGMLDGASVPSKGVMEAASSDIHKRSRNRRGRINRNVIPFHVLKESSIKALVKQKQSHVGKAKGGWLKSAAGVGLKSIPAWITKHTNSPGAFIDNRSYFGKPSLTFINSTPGAEPQQQSIIASAYRTLLSTMAKQLKHIAEKRLKNK